MDMQLKRWKNNQPGDISRKTGVQLPRQGARCRDHGAKEGITTQMMKPTIQIKSNEDLRLEKGATSKEVAVYDFSSPWKHSIEPLIFE